MRTSRRECGKMGLPCTLDPMATVRMWILKTALSTVPCTSEGGEQQVDGSWTFSRPRLTVMKLKSRDGAPFTDGEKRSFVSAVVAEMVLPDGWHVYERFRLG